MQSPRSAGFWSYFQQPNARMQVAEIVLGLLVWCLIVSGPYARHYPLRYALGAHITAWILTIIIFLSSMFGITARINDFFKSRSAGTSEDNASLTVSNTGSYMTALEYVLYMILSGLLLIASVTITANLSGSKVWFAACAFSWLLSVLYEIHFCILFRNVESHWPLQWLYGCCKGRCGKKTSTENYERITETAGSSQ